MRNRLAARPLGAAAVAIVAAEALVAAAGVGWPALAVLAIVLAPGLALAPLLPEETRARPAALLAAAPVLGFAAASCALVTAASLGMSLGGVEVRLVLAALVLGGLALPAERELAREPGRDLAFAAAALGLAVVAGLVIGGRVLSGPSVPGNDWAKYVLYADEIRRQGSLLIHNDLWMLGVPFREDPGAPSVYGAYLVLTDGSAGGLTHGILLFAALGVLGVFAWVDSVWGRGPALVAAGLWAVVPINHDMLGWHGLANEAGLALLTLVMLWLTTLARRELGWLEAGGFALVLLALACAHRLSLVLGLGAAALTVAALAGLGARRELLRSLLRVAAVAVLAGGGVAYDLITRARSFGGNLDYTAYLSSKVHLGPVVFDLTRPVAILGVAAVLGALWLVRRERELVVPLCALAVTVALAYAWIVHVPAVYFRMAYFLPLALIPLIAVIGFRTLGARGATVAAVLLLTVTAAFAWRQAPNVREFYAFTNPASLRGLEALSAELEPGEVVVTDRCWSFLATWLLHTRTLPALEPADIQPKAELARATEAREILEGTARGRTLARSLGVRYMLLDPTCTDAAGRSVTPPVAGDPLYLSRRLVILRAPR